VAVTALAALASLILVLPAIGDGASAATLRTAALRTTSAQYLAEIKSDASEIAAHIGHGLSLSERVVVNAKEEYKNTPAYSFVEDKSGDTTGAPSQCVTHINPSFTSEDAEYQKLALIHETFHCFEAMDFPTVSAFLAAPDWLIEGEAEWVGATLAPTELDVWNAYLTGLSTSLFARSYDAIGFYAHMTNSGENTWHLLDPMLRAGGSAAAYSVAANKEVRLTWASSLARQPGLGKGWDTTGPGITSATYHPGIYKLANGSKFSDSVAPYANGLVRFQVKGADVVDLSVNTQYSRLHTSNGTEYDNLSKGPAAFCVNNCGKCPQVEALPKLAPGGVNWLAVTGDTSGATYTIVGTKATCQPCLVGSWVATNISLTTSPGGTHAGGAGTTVDILPNGDAISDFTPGGPLVGAGGSVKFGGTQTDHYSFSPTTTARSGGFELTPVSYQSTITVGGLTENIKPEVVPGSYTCTGNDLTLTFSAGATQALVYDLVPAS